MPERQQTTEHDERLGPVGRFIIAFIMAAANLQRRLLAVVFSAIGPRNAYAVTALFARIAYALFEPIRRRSEAQCRAALSPGVSHGQADRIAAEAWVHRWWNLTDLLLTDRFLHANTFRRYGGELTDDLMRRFKKARDDGRPMILLTSYYGPYDLLPVFMGFQGIRPLTVYRRHQNAAYGAFRDRIRRRSGCRMVDLDAASQGIGDELARGGVVGIVADHNADRGYKTTFLGLPTIAHRTVGLLAWRYDASVIVAGIQRVRRSFQFRVVVTDIIDPPDWAGEDNPVDFVMDRYIRGVERLVRDDPTQYLWSYARWGREVLRSLLAQTESGNKTG